MTRVLQPTNPTNAPVIPGTQVVTQMPMATAVNAGDYVYMTQSGVGVAASSGSAGVNTQIVGTTALTTTISTGSLPGYQYGPIVQQATYSGTSYTLGQSLAGPTTYTTAATNSTVQLVTTLQNGNFVVGYLNTNWYFSVYNSSGTLVAGPTLLALAAAANSSGTQATISLFPTNDGGFGFCYSAGSGSTTVNVQLFNSSGTFVSSSSFTATGSTIYYGLSMSQLTNGNYAFVFKDSSSNGYWMVLSSAFATVASGNVHFNTSYRSMNNAWGLVPLTQGGFVIHYYNGGFWFFNGFTNAGVAFSEWPVNLNYIMPSRGSTDLVTACPTADGNMALAYPSGDNNFYVTRLAVSIAGGGFGNYTVSNGVSLGNNMYASQIFPIQNNGVGVYYLYNGNSIYVSYSTTPNTVNGGVPSTTMNTGVSVFGGTAYRQYYNNCMFFNNSSQRTFIPYCATSNYGYFQITSSIALTNGQTITGPSFSPPTYLFQGVSLNTVSAGQVANVTINGVATLNSSYPSLSSTVTFDYSGFGPFGNKGQVYGRNVTLKGVE